MQNQNEKVVFQGKMIEVVHETIISNGKEIVLEKGRRAPGVRLIVEAPDGEYLITKEERHNIGLDYRIAGGKVFDSLIEYNDFLTNQKSEEEILIKAEQSMIREGIEEVGIKPTEYKLFCISKCGGSLDWDLYYFVISKYEEVGQKLEEHEKIEVVKVSVEKLKDLALSGAMAEDRSVAVILKYLNQKQ
ncbi:MAG: ADP-ribose pyrophosphatase [Patescibacteria group bacterium]|nr:ADP-ribose pyrophosphatase [Patescibacteria group bacterium]